MRLLVLVEMVFPTAHTPACMLLPSTLYRHKGLWQLRGGVGVLGPGNPAPGHNSSQRSSSDGPVLGKPSSTDRYLFLPEHR